MSNTVTPQNFFDESNVLNIIDSYIDDNPTTGEETNDDYKDRLTKALYNAMKDLKSKEYKSIDEVKKAIYLKLSAYVNKTSESYKEDEVTADSRARETEIDTDPTKSGQIGSFLFGIRDANMQLSKFEQGLISFEVEKKEDPEYQDKDFDEKRNLYKRTHGAITNNDKTTFNVYGLGDGYNNPSIGKNMDSTYFENWVKQASESVMKTIYPKLKNSVIHRPADFSSKSMSQNYKSINITSVDDFDGVQLSHNIDEKITNIFSVKIDICEEFTSLREIFTLFYKNYEKALTNKYVSNKDDTKEEDEEKENTFNETKKKSIEYNFAILKDCYIFCMITLCLLKKQYMKENEYRIAEEIDEFISERWMYHEVMSVLELYKKASEYENIYGSDRISDYLKKFIKHEFFPERRDLANISLVFDNEQAYNDEFTIKELVKLFYENMERKNFIIQNQIDNIQEKVRRHFYNNQFPIKTKIRVKHILSKEITLFLGKNKEDFYDELEINMEFRNVTYGSSNPSLVIKFNTLNMRDEQKVLFDDFAIDIDKNVFPHDKFIRDVLISDYRHAGKTHSMIEMKKIYDEVLADRYRWKENKNMVYEKLFDTIFDHKEMMEKIKCPEKLEKLVHNLLLNVMVLIKERQYDDNNVKQLIINEFFSLIYPYFSENNFIQSLKKLVLLESQLLENNNNYNDVLVNFEQTIKNHHDDKDVTAMQKKNQIDAKKQRERDNQENLKNAKEDLSVIQKKYAKIDSDIYTLRNDISKQESELKTLREKKKADVDRKNKQKKAANDANKQEKGTQQGESKTKADNSMEIIKAKEDKIKTMEESLKDLVLQLKALSKSRDEQTNKVNGIEEFINSGDEETEIIPEVIQKAPSHQKDTTKQKKKSKKDLLSAEERLIQAEEMLKIQQEKQIEIQKQIELGRQRKLAEATGKIIQNETSEPLADDNDYSDRVPEEKTVFIREVNNSFEMKIVTKLVKIPDGYSKTLIDENRKISVLKRSVDNRIQFKSKPVPRKIRSDILSGNEEFIPLVKEFFAILTQIGIVIRERIQTLKKSHEEYFAPMEIVFKIETPFHKRQDAERKIVSTATIRVKNEGLSTTRTKFAGLFGKNFIDLRTIKPLDDGDKKLFGTKKGTGAMYPHQANFCELIHRAISQNEQNFFIEVKSNLGSGKTTSVIAAAKIVSSYNKSVDISTSSKFNNVYKDNNKALMIFSTTSKKSLFELFVKFNSGVGVSNTEVIGIFDKSNSGFSGRAGDGLSYFYYDPMAGRKRSSFIKQSDVYDMAYMNAQIICGHPRNIVKYIAEKEKYQISRKVVLIIDEVATGDDHNDNEDKKDDDETEKNKNNMNTNNEHALAVLFHLPGIQTIAVLSASLDDSPAVNFIMDQQSKYTRFPGERDISNNPLLKGRETAEIRANMDRERNTQTISSKFVIVPSNLLQINGEPMDNFDGYNNDSVISQVVTNETFRRFLSYRNVDEFAKIGGYGNSDNDVLIRCYEKAIENASDFDEAEYTDLVEYSSSYWKNAIKNNVYDSAIFCTNIARYYQKLYRKYFPMSHEDYLSDTNESIAKYEQYRKEKYNAALQIEKLLKEYDHEARLFSAGVFSFTDNQIFNLFFRKGDSLLSDNVFFDKNAHGHLYDSVIEPVVNEGESRDDAIERENREYVENLRQELNLIREEKDKLHRLKEKNTFVKKEDVHDEEILEFNQFAKYRSLFIDQPRVKNNSDDSLNQLRVERLGLMKIERNVRSRSIGRLPAIPNHDYNLDDFGDMEKEEIMADESAKIAQIRERLDRISIDGQIFNKVSLVDEINGTVDALSNFYLYNSDIELLNEKYNTSMKIATLCEIKYKENLTMVRNLIEKYWSFDKYLKYDLSEMQSIVSNKNSGQKNNIGAGMNLSRAKVLIAEIKQSLSRIKNAAYDLFSDSMYKASTNKSQLISDEMHSFDREVEKYSVMRKKLIDLNIDQIDIEKYIQETIYQARQVMDEDERILKCPEYVLVATRDPVSKANYVYGELIRKVNYATWKFINDYESSLESDNKKDVFTIKEHQNEKEFVKKAKKASAQGADVLYEFYKAEMEDVNEYHESKNNHHYITQLDSDTRKFAMIRNKFFRNTRYNSVLTFMTRLVELLNNTDMDKEERDYLISEYKKYPFYKNNNTKFEYIKRHTEMVRRFIDNSSKKEQSQDEGSIKIYNEQIKFILNAHDAVLPYGIVTVNGIELSKLFKRNSGKIEDADFQDFAQYILKIYVSTEDYELPPENQKINRCFGNSKIAHRINRPFEAVLITKSFESESSETITQICGRSGRPGKSDTSVIYMSHPCYQEILSKKETPLDNLAYRVKHYLQTEDDDIYGKVPGKEKNELRRITLLYNRIAPVSDEKRALIEQQVDIEAQKNKKAPKKGKIVMSN